MFGDTEKMHRKCDFDVWETQERHTESMFGCMGDTGETKTVLKCLRDSQFCQYFASWTSLSRLPCLPSARPQDTKDHHCHHK